MNLKGIAVGNGCTGTDAGTCSPQRSVNTFEELAAQGFGARELRDAGFHPARFTGEAGYSVQQLVDAGFAEDEVQEAGFDQKAIDSVFRPPKKAPMRRKR